MKQRVVIIVAVCIAVFTSLYIIGPWKIDYIPLFITYALFIISMLVLTLLINKESQVNK